jgi:Cupin-like domain
VPRRIELKRLATADKATMTRLHHREPLEAAIFAGAASAWPAVAQWSPAYFAQHYGEVSVQCYRNLPDIMVPQTRKDSSHRAVERVADFVDHVEDGERCYIHSTDARIFPGLDVQFDFSPLLPDTPNPVFVKLWFGAKTRSGLHFDPRDNLFTQIYGRKRVYLVAPADNGRIYPFPSDITKSQVDPTRDHDPDRPRFDGATVHEGLLEPGDVLFIPRGWWHHICAEDASISLNCFYGEPMTAGDLARGVTEASPLLWMPIMRDAVRYGLCEALFEPGLFATPPSGKLFYDLVFDRNGTRSLIPFRF